MAAKRRKSSNILRASWPLCFSFAFNCIFCLVFCRHISEPWDVQRGDPESEPLQVLHTGTDQKNDLDPISIFALPVFEGKTNTTRRVCQEKLPYFSRRDGWDGTVDLICLWFGLISSGWKKCVKSVKYVFMTQMPLETDSANSSTISSFKSRAQVIYGYSTSWLVWGSQHESTADLPCFSEPFFFFFYVSCQEHETIQQEQATSSESVDDAAIERYVRFIFLYFQSFVVFFIELSACNNKTTTLQSIIFQLCQPWPMGSCHLNLTLIKRLHQETSVMAILHHMTLHSNHLLICR